MRIVITFLFSLALFSQPAYAQFGDLLKKASDSAKQLGGLGGTGDQLDISNGLKEALEIGVDSAVVQLSQVNGYMESPYKILIPEEAKTVVGKLKHVPGFRDVEYKMTQKMNEAAELAVKKATPVFVSAIKQMSFADAKEILLGQDDAATRYLEKSSGSKLYEDFMPMIKAALDEVDATKYWNSVVSKYNKLPLTKDVNENLDDHVTQKAISGLFGLIEVKESGIRNDIGQRTSPLLRDVFGQLDNK